MQVLPPYTQTRSPFAAFVWNTFWLGLAVAAGLVYGYMAAIGPVYFLPALTVGVVTVMLLVVALCPPPATIPVNSLTRFLFASFVFAYLFPAYFALILPGMPWLNLNRILMIIFIVTYAYLFLASKSFQSENSKLLQPGLIILIGALAPTVVGTGVLIARGQVAGLASPLMEMATTFTYIAGMAFILNKSGNRALVLFFYTVIFLLSYSLVIGSIEKMLEMVLWRSFVPPGFGGADSDLIQIQLSSAYRGADYRVKGIFSNPLLYGEFVSICSVFILAGVFYFQNATTKLFLAFLYLYCIYAALVFPAARLPVPGMVAAMGVFGCLVIMNLRQHHGGTSLFANVAVTAIPVSAILGIMMLMFVRPVQRLIWGGSEHYGSNLAREKQWDQAWAAFPNSPIFGYGFGRAASVAGNTGPFGDRTILDSYYINVLLDSGIVGSVLYASGFLFAVVVLSKIAIALKTQEKYLYAALASVLVAKMLVNQVLSLEHNHVFLYLPYGVAIWVCFRYSKELKEFRWLPKRGG